MAVVHLEPDPSRPRTLRRPVATRILRPDHPRARALRGGCSLDPPKPVASGLAAAAEGWPFRSATAFPHAGEPPAYRRRDGGAPQVWRRPAGASVRTRVRTLLAPLHIEFS